MARCPAEPAAKAAARGTQRQAPALLPAVLRQQLQAHTRNAVRFTYKANLHWALLYKSLLCFGLILRFTSNAGAHGAF